jgi:hypothetical protein
MFGDNKTVDGRSKKGTVRLDSSVAIERNCNGHGRDGTLKHKRRQT